MIKNKSDKKEKRLEIDLRGPEGNAYWLLGAAEKLGKELGLDTKKIQDEMSSDDYENLINVFDSYFGDYVILYR
jgi:hypothetical protein